MDSMLEVPSKFFNDEDKSFMEAGDMDDSKEETDGHTLASNTDNDRRRCCSQDRVSYGSTCQRVHQRGNVGQAFDKHHSDPPSLFAMCVGMCPRWIGGRSFYLYLLWRICCSVLMSTEERGCSVLLCEVVNHWQTEHTPSKGDGYAYVRRFNVIYQYNTIQGWGLLLSGAMCQQSRSHEGN